MPLSPVDHDAVIPCPHSFRNADSKMRIAYGVMGYGRGHAMRARAVLPSLMAEHEVTVFAGGDAHQVLSQEFPTVEIPVIGYQYNAAGDQSVARTIGANAGRVLDLLGRGQAARQLEQDFRERGIQLLISDSDTWTHKTAQRLGIPRISFDHVGIIAYCQPHFPAELWAAGMRDAAGYRAFMGEPERILISSFYPAQPRKAGTEVVGPILREEVLAAKPVNGDYLLVYLNKGEHQYNAQLDRTLRLLDCPVRIYGTAYRGASDNLDFRAPSNQRFLDDLSGARAVISTAGNVLTGEATYLGKPILAVPENAFEQRLNASIIERLGIGMQGRLKHLHPADVDHFLGQLEQYRYNMTDLRQDGRQQARQTLARFIDELAPAARTIGRRPQQKRRQPLPGALPDSA